MYAYVVYLRDGYRKVIPVTDIRGFHPKSVRDYNSNVRYKALWTGKNDEIPAETADKVMMIIATSKLVHGLSVRSASIPKAGRWKSNNAMKDKQTLQTKNVTMCEAITTVRARTSSRTRAH